jgi:hypothetical protein
MLLASLARQRGNKNGAGQDYYLYALGARCLARVGGGAWLVQGGWVMHGGVVGIPFLPRRHGHASFAQPYVYVESDDTTNLQYFDASCYSETSANMLVYKYVRKRPRRNHIELLNRS